MDNEVKGGVGNHLSFGDFGYDTRVARRFNLDPIDQIFISNYAVFGNDPIYYADPSGYTIFDDIGEFFMGRETTPLAPGTNGFFSDVGDMFSNFGNSLASSFNPMSSSFGDFPSISMPPTPKSSNGSSFFEDMINSFLITPSKMDIGVGLQPNQQVIQEDYSYGDHRLTEGMPLIPYQVNNEANISLNYENGMINGTVNLFMSLPHDNHLDRFDIKRRAILRIYNGDELLYEANIIKNNVPSIFSSEEDSKYNYKTFIGYTNILLKDQYKYLIFVIESDYDILEDGQLHSRTNPFPNRHTIIVQPPVNILRGGRLD